MRVFKMNEYDWVCAVSEEEAKEYYLEETGIEVEDIEEDFVEEVSLNDTMHVFLSDLPEEELSMPQTTLEKYGETWVLKSFDWVIKNLKITKPCIISSTEY